MTSHAAHLKGWKSNPLNMAISFPASVIYTCTLPVAEFSWPYHVFLLDDSMFLLDSARMTVTGSRLEKKP